MPSTALVPEKHKAAPILEELSKQPEDILPRRSGQARPDHGYWLLDNPNARQPGAQHKQPDIAPGTMDPNSATLLGAVFTALHGDTMPNEAPLTLDEAKKCADWPKWKEAMDKEISTLRKMDTWKMTNLAQDRKPILCQWVYALKKNVNGDIIRYKA